jgi:hypothetical protein
LKTGLRMPASLPPVQKDNRSRCKVFSGLSDTATIVYSPRRALPGGLNKWIASALRTTTKVLDDREQLVQRDGVKTCKSPSKLRHHLTNQREQGRGRTTPPTSPTSRYSPPALRRTDFPQWSSLAWRCCLQPQCPSFKLLCSLMMVDRDSH